MLNLKVTKVICVILDLQKLHFHNNASYRFKTNMDFKTNLMKCSKYHLFQVQHLGKVL